jgi:hypothetical protein
MQAEGSAIEETISDKDFYRNNNEGLSGSFLN